MQSDAEFFHAMSANGQLFTSWIRARRKDSRAANWLRAHKLLLALLIGACAPVYVRQSECAWLATPICLFAATLMIPDKATRYAAQIAALI